MYVQVYVYLFLSMTLPISFAATIVHKFEDCLGIEILENLYEISVEVGAWWLVLAPLLK